MCVFVCLELPYVGIIVIKEVANKMASNHLLSDCQLLSCLQNVFVILVLIRVVCQITGCHMGEGMYYVRFSW